MGWGDPARGASAPVDPRERGPVIHGGKTRLEACPSCGQLRMADAQSSPTGVHHVGWDEHSKRGIPEPRDPSDTTGGGW